jgi:hypothetical protein
MRRPGCENSSSNDRMPQAVDEDGVKKRQDRTRAGQNSLPRRPVELPFLFRLLTKLAVVVLA